MMTQGKTQAPRLVFLSRRAYETKTVRLVLRSADTWDARDTGFQLLEGSETGLELVNPENSLLMSTERALALEPRLMPLLSPETPPENAAYRLDDDANAFLPTEIPKDPPTQ